MSLGPDARDLIAMADGADDPTSADEARIRAKLAARLAIAAGTGIAATTAAKTATASAGKAATVTLATKLAIGVAVVSATTAGGTVLYEHATHDRAPVVVEAPPAPLPAIAPAKPITPAPPATTATATERSTEIPEPPATAAIAISAPSAKPPAKASAKPAPTSIADPGTVTLTDTIAEEAALLRAAHGSLARGDGAGAMASLDEHARRHPRGALAEEREAAKVMALCTQGRASEARAAASAFVSANPRSPFAAQVRRSCASRDE